MSDRIYEAYSQRLRAMLTSMKPSPAEAQAIERDILAILGQNPDHPAWNFLLGTYYLHTDRSGLACALIHRAIQCGLKGAAPWLNLAGAYKVDHNDKQANEAYLHAIKEAEHHPNFVNGVNIDLSAAYHGVASLFINAGQPDMCLYWCSKALEINPTDRYALWNKGIAHLERGDWEEGFRLYDEAGFIASEDKPPERKIKTYGGLPKWQGETGKTVIVYGEQGLGDEVMFASVLPDMMRDNKVIIDCDKRLVSLFERSFPGVEAVYGTSSWDAPFPWVKDHKPDCYAPMGNLGRYYRKKPADFPKTPFLTPDPEKRAFWRAHLAQFKGLKVGISYMGGLKKTRQDMRTIPLDQWEPILKVAGCDFFSLQYHDFAADMAAQTGTKLGIPIHHWGDTIGTPDYGDTAAFMAELDLVISVNTSLIHLAGSIGAPTWCLTPAWPAWRYGVSGPNPWYGSVVTYRQKKKDQWTPVVSKVAEDLAAVVAKERAVKPAPVLSMSGAVSAPIHVQSEPPAVAIPVALQDEAPPAAAYVPKTCGSTSGCA